MKLKKHTKIILCALSQIHVHVYENLHQQRYLSIQYVSFLHVIFLNSNSLVYYDSCTMIVTFWPVKLLHRRCLNHLHYLGLSWQACAVQQAAGGAIKLLTRIWYEFQLIEVNSRWGGWSWFLQNVFIVICLYWLCVSLIVYDEHNFNSLRVCG